MSTTVSIPTARRTSVLAAASALVAAASVTVALALSGGGGDDAIGSKPSAAPATATPDRATLYRNAVEAGQQSGPAHGPSAAERFHHFR